jgi:hypothetical protein
VRRKIDSKVWNLLTSDMALFNFIRQSHCRNQNPFLGKVPRLSGGRRSPFARIFWLFLRVTRGATMQQGAKRHIRGVDLESRGKRLGLMTKVEWGICRFLLFSDWSNSQLILTFSSKRLIEHFPTLQRWLCTVQPMIYADSRPPQLNQNGKTLRKKCEKLDLNCDRVWSLCITANSRF